MAPVMQCALHDVQQLLWLARSLDLANWTRMGHDEAETCSFSSARHNHCRIVTTDAGCFGQSITGWHSAPLWLFVCENTCLHFCQRGLYWCDCLGTPYCDMCFSFGLNLSSYTPTMINYLSYQFAIQWNCAWSCCIFFSSSVFCLLL